MEPFESFFPLCLHCDLRRHRASETQNFGRGKQNERHFLPSELLRLRAADVPLSNEPNPVIAPEKPYKKADTESLRLHWAASGI